jgi:hypothetical protein
MIFLKLLPPPAVVPQPTPYLRPRLSKKQIEAARAGVMVRVAGMPFDDDDSGQNLIF